MTVYKVNTEDVYSRSNKAVEALTLEKTTLEAQKEEVWGGGRRYGEEGGGMGRREEVWGGGRRYGEEGGGMGRREEVWGGGRRYGEEGGVRGGGMRRREGYGEEGGVWGGGRGVWGGGTGRRYGEGVGMKCREGGGEIACLSLKDEKTIRHMKQLNLMKYKVVTVEDAIRLVEENGDTLPLDSSQSRGAPLEKGLSPGAQALQLSQKGKKDTLQFTLGVVQRNLQRSDQLEMINTQLDLLEAALGEDWGGEGWPGEEKWTGEELGGLGMS